MKPRLNPCALTDEDFQIIVGMRVQCHERTLKPEFWYLHADRRDADLMLKAQQWRANMGGWFDELEFALGDVRWLESDSLA